MDIFLSDLNFITMWPHLSAPEDARPAPTQQTQQTQQPAIVFRNEQPPKQDHRVSGLDSLGGGRII